MLKCWNHLPKDRPTFDELCKELLELERKGSPYVKLEKGIPETDETEGM